MSSSQFRRGKRRFDDDKPTFLKRDRHRRRLPPADFGSETFGLPEGDRWSTISTQWASAEFAALSQLCAAGLPVPYPVQILQTELLLEFIGEPDGTAAPQLAETRPAGTELASLWDQLVTALCGLARLGYAHGDLSAYNLLVHGGRLVMIDMPQIVDVIANPRGAEFVTRDWANVARWFTARGLTGVTPAPADLAGLLLAEARLS
jgi:RIO kinase 1